MPNYFDGTLAHARTVLIRPAPRVTRFNRCVGQQLSGSRPGSRAAVQAAFTSATKSCKGTRGGRVTHGYEGGREASLF